MKRSIFRILLALTLPLYVIGCGAASDDGEATHTHEDGATHADHDDHDEDHDTGDDHDENHDEDHDDDDHSD